jgi:hypothetical protein
MIVFDNTTTSGSFSIVLRDKLVGTDPTPEFKLRLTKLDDFSVDNFILTNVSSSNDYYTFSIDPSSLEQGGYKAEILESAGATADCIVATPESVDEVTYFVCDPLDLSAEFTVNAEAVFDLAERTDTSIWVGKARVDGAIYNTVYTYDQGPTYYVYDE